MKVIEKLRYYLVEVRLHKNIIQCYDLATNKILASVSLPEELATLRKEASGNYLILNEEEEIICEILIHMHLLSKKSQLQTQAEYILDLHMDSPSHGYYFGYYEIGEFRLTNDLKLEKIRSYSLENCISGRVTKSRTMYLGCREDDDYFLVKLKWKFDDNPNFICKKSVSSAIMAMELLDDLLFLGLKNGHLQIWDTLKDKTLKNLELFSSTISAMSIIGDCIIVGNRTGGIACITTNGEIRWKTNLTDGKIVGIYEERDYILIINDRGEQFHVNINSGNPKKHGYTNLKLGGNIGLSSNIIEFRNRLVITGYGGIWTFRWGNDNNSYHKYQDDPLMRVIHQHPFGFYSGDDNGCICFWDIGIPEIRVENYSPPLKDYEAYLKLKAERLAYLSQATRDYGADIEKKLRLRKKKRS